MFSQMRSASFSRLGRPACGASSASTSGAMPFLKSWAMTPVANTQRPALMPCANFTLPAPSSTGSNGSAILLVIQSNPCSSPGSIASLRRRGKMRRTLTPVRVRHTIPALHFRRSEPMKFALRWMSWIGICLAATVTAWAQADNYPNRTITVVVPFPAGGLTDVPARLAMSLLRDKIGQPVVIENRTGASGTIGAAYVTRAAPDGYTLHANSIGDAQNIHYMPLSYHPVDDFAMVGWIVDGPPMILVIDAKLPIKTVAELVADAKANPSKYSIGTSGPASSPNAALAQFNATAGIQLQAVHYRGSGESATAVASSAIQGTFTYFSQGKTLVDSGRLSALAVAGSKSMEAWPDVTTFTELGFKIDVRGFVGLGAPARTPKPIVAYLNKQLNEVLQTDRFKTPMAELGMAPPPAADNTPEKFEKFIRDEIARQGVLAELTGQKLAPPKQ